MISPSHIEALRKVSMRLKDKDICWAVTGSMNMAMQGMAVEVHDIDLQTNEAGAYKMQALLQAYVVTPVRYLASERMHSHLGKLVIDGVEVEIIGGLQKLLPDGTWEAPLDVAAHTCLVEIEGMQVPGLTLDYEYQAYVLMGRMEKAELLRQWLEESDQG